MPDIAFSRGPGIAGMGKCDDDVRVRMPSDVKADLQIEARKHGMTDSEFVRDLVMLRLYGLAHLARMHEARLRDVGGLVVGSGNGPAPT